MKPISLISYIVRNQHISEMPFAYSMVQNMPKIQMIKIQEQYIQNSILIDENINHQQNRNQENIKVKKEQVDEFNDVCLKQNIQLLQNNFNKLLLYDLKKIKNFLCNLYRLIEQRFTKNLKSQIKILKFCKKFYKIFLPQYCPQLCLSEDQKKSIEANLIYNIMSYLQWERHIKYFKKPAPKKKLKVNTFEKLILQRNLFPNRQKYKYIMSKQKISQAIILLSNIQIFLQFVLVKTCCKKQFEESKQKYFQRMLFRIYKIVCFVYMIRQYFQKKFPPKIQFNDSECKKEQN